MCGISGSGKTFHALRLTHEGYVRLSVDNLVWQKVGKNLFKLSQKEQKFLFDECKEEVRRQLKTLLQSGINVVVDATHCRRAARDEVRCICQKAGVKPVFAYCEAEEEELWNRLSQRGGTGPDDLIVTREELSRYWQGFERPQPDETDFIVINTDEDIIKKIYNED